MYLLKYVLGPINDKLLPGLEKITKAINPVDHAEEGFYFHFSKNFFHKHSFMYSKKNAEISSNPQLKMNKLIHSKKVQQTVNRTLDQIPLENQKFQRGKKPNNLKNWLDEQQRMKENKELIISEVYDLVLEKALFSVESILISNPARRFYRGLVDPRELKLTDVGMKNIGMSLLLQDLTDSKERLKFLVEYKPETTRSDKELISKLVTKLVS